MYRSDEEVRAEIGRLEDGIKWADEVIIEFDDDPHMGHNFIVLRSKYQMKIKTLKWVLNET